MDEIYLIQKESKNSQVQLQEGAMQGRLKSATMPAILTK